MVDKIVELDNNKKYVILDETNIDDVTYCFGLRLTEDEEPTNNYLFFEEIKDNDNIYLNKVTDDKLKGLLLTSFTINYVGKVYDEVNNEEV